MTSLSNLLFLMNLLFSASSSLASAQPGFWFYNCTTTGNYTANSPFAANLNTFLSTLTSGNHLDSGGSSFYNLTVGSHPGGDLVSGAASCRGDVASSDCLSCWTDAAQEIRQICPYQKEAIGFYRNCMIRYSNHPIWDKSMEWSPQFSIVKRADASQPEEFDSHLKVLLWRLRAELTAAGRRANWATDSIRVSGFGNLYGLSQCVPYLNSSDCSKCLENLMNYIPKCCYGKTGASVVSMECGSRFDIYRFYVRPSDDLALSPSPSSLVSVEGTYKQRRKSLRIIYTAIVVSTPIAILLAIAIWIYRRKRKFLQSVHKEMEDIKELESLQFELTTVKIATRNFSLENKLGEGGFGEVYRGKLASGQTIAVKRLSKNSGQGITEFKNELVLVAKLQHKNLVRLLGFCLTLDEKILVYEFIPNTSLDRFLFDPATKNLLDWDTRHKIIHGIARGLLYLHEDSRLKVVHRDLKSSNILLDEAMNPKISDFGLAKFFDEDETQGKTRRIVGTYGYMAPEYVMTGQFSVKSDVYSFGVMILEIISGQKNRSFARFVYEETLLHRAWRLWNEKKISDLVDPALENKYVMEEVTKCIHIGLSSIQEDPIQRPRMTSIVAALSGDPNNLMEPKSPQFLGHFIGVQSISNDSRNLHDLGNGSRGHQAISSYSGTKNITNIYPR